MSDQTNDPAKSEIPKIVEYAIYAALLYLGACIYVWMSFDHEKLKLHLINYCGYNSAFCNCQANAASREFTFFKAPLIMLRIVQPEKYGPQCRIYLR